jgi:hypothetical protein
MISDEKIGPSGVKVRCKKCGNVIPVKRAGASSGATPAPVERGAMTPAPGLEPVEPKAGAMQPPVSLASLQAEAGLPGAAAQVAAPAQAGPEWYVAIEERQVGPLAPAGVKARWDAGEIGPDTLAWRAGMSDWAAIGAIPEMVQALGSKLPPPTERDRSARSPPTLRAPPRCPTGRRTGP